MSIDTYDTNVLEQSFMVSLTLFHMLGSESDQSSHRLSTHHRGSHGEFPKAAMAYTCLNLMCPHTHFND
jgi:hypothetical protein